MEPNHKLQGNAVRCDDVNGTVHVQKEQLENNNPQTLPAKTTWSKTVTTGSWKDWKKKNCGTVATSNDKKMNDDDDDTVDMFGRRNSSPTTTINHDRYRIDLNQIDQVLGPSIGNSSNSSADGFSTLHHDLITALNKTEGVPKAALKNDYYGRKKLLTIEIDQTFKNYYHTWSDQNPKTHLLLWTCIFVCPITGELFFAGRWNYTKTNPPTQICYPNNVSHKEEKTSKDLNSTNSSIKLSSSLNIVVDATPMDEEQMKATTTTEIDPNSNCNIVTNTYQEETRNNANNNCTNKNKLWWFPKKDYAEHGAAAVCFDCKVTRERQYILEQELQNKQQKRPYRIPAPVRIIGKEQAYLEQDAILSLDPSIRRRTNDDDDTTNNDKNDWYKMIPSTIRTTIMEQQRIVFARMRQQQELVRQQQQHELHNNKYNPTSVVADLQVYDGDDDDVENYGDEKVNEFDENSYISDEDFDDERMT